MINLQKMAKFSKVSLHQFTNDWFDSFPALMEADVDVVRNHIKHIYDNIKLPQRATVGSAGYDFFSPISFTLEPNESIKIPTGIRCEMYDGWVMLGFPRSGYGFKYGIHHANDIPVVDGDYAYSDNEGHIFFKLVNDSSLAKTVKIDAGTAFCQTVFVPFGITLDDSVTEKRNGGLGSSGM